MWSMYSDLPQWYHDESRIVWHGPEAHTCPYGHFWGWGWAAWLMEAL